MGGEEAQLLTETRLLLIMALNECSYIEWVRGLQGCMCHPMYGNKEESVTLGENRTHTLTRHFHSAILTCNIIEIKPLNTKSEICNLNRIFIHA
jgi:hypothetical protein